MRLFSVFMGTVLLCSVAWGQQQAASSDQRDMSDMQDMPGMNHSDNDPTVPAPVMHDMEGHMDMGPHMHMTALRQPKPGDQERADQVAKQAREVAEKYADYRTALADGFKIFLPNVPQKVYHFSNRRYGFEAQFHFNPEHPTSLLYEKVGAGYKIVGVMYTAPRQFTEDQLDERIPLSVAEWHQHVNFCTAPLGRIRESFGPNPQFGFRGSIHTQEACDAAGGTFHPVVLNWMVHIYPFETNPAKIWSTDIAHAD